MIEQTIEAKIIAQLEALLPDALFVGFWQPIPTGKSIKLEPPLISLVCNIASGREGTRQYTSNFSSNILTPPSNDPDKTKTVAWAKALSEYYKTLSEHDSGALSAISEAGVYTVTGATIGQGNSGFESGPPLSLYTNLSMQLHFCTCA